MTLNIRIRDKRREIGGLTCHWREYKYINSERLAQKEMMNKEMKSSHRKVNLEKS
jgi:hypothetical protein